MRPGSARLPVILASVALVALALGAGAAEAQLGEPRLRIAVAPFDAPARPLLTPVFADVAIEASCTLAQGVPPSVVVEVEVVEAPPWATVVLQPPQMIADATPEACAAGMLRLDAQVIATVNQHAPALAATPIRLAVRATDATGAEEAAVGEVEIEATYFGILDVATPSAIQHVPPGEEVAFPLQVANHGNGEIRVTFTRLDEPGALRAEAPHDLVLESRQQGGQATSGEAVVRAWAADERGPHAVTILIVARSTQDPDAPAEADRVTLLVVTESPPLGPPVTGLDVPLPHAWPPVAAVLAALVLRAASRRRHV